MRAAMHIRPALLLALLALPVTAGASEPAVRRAALLDGAAPDPRMAEAIERIRDARQPDGTWLQARRHPGRVWFEVDVPAGHPSPWLTLVATRVLAWWDEASREHRG